ncbi:Probable RNA-directed DNA polymerase from transposon BS [Eumeta japonica]|uniref:Probable RNA-directed DNA polymerase from transposon BS n=1 Tax=Eumeta variegata TaxID=151549 RepID=A0A4C1X5N3_EUMVA|nr:Probable RNA-directed DNA polymerase from transposon BS [Eumeta japonica]
MLNKQFGFTRGHSTIDAGVELVQHVFGAWEDSRDAISIFCDLSKAFDCVHHETLIGKLRHYGVTGRALDLLKSYLSNRVQRVDVNVRNKELEFVNSTVFLGITLDDRLQWGPHINQIPEPRALSTYLCFNITYRSILAGVGTHAPRIEMFTGHAPFLYSVQKYF